MHLLSQKETLINSVSGGQEFSSKSAADNVALSLAIVIQNMAGAAGREGSRVGSRATDKQSTT